MLFQLLKAFFCFLSCNRLRKSFECNIRLNRLHYSHANVARGLPFEWQEVDRNPFLLVAEIPKVMHQILITLHWWAVPFPVSQKPDTLIPIIVRYQLNLMFVRFIVFVVFFSIFLQLWKSLVWYKVPVYLNWEWISCLEFHLSRKEPLSH